jgi:hypothetical protein
MIRYVKRANQSMSKIDGLLKTLQVRPSPPEALVQAYLIHIADRSDTNFKKILELKGIRKQEQSTLVDLFNAHCGASSYANLPANSTFLTPLQITTAPQASGGIGSLKDATSMGTPKFDAATFGSALMNVAREGVDRFGSPALGTSTSDTGSPASANLSEGQGSNLNENLKNIGKFFRRDTGAFGRFGRSAGEGSK